MAKNPKPVRKSNARFRGAWFIEATFQPKRRDDLSPDAPPVGSRLRYRRGWVMEPGFNRYTGHLVWLPAGMTCPWVPGCDLTGVKVLRASR